MLRSFACGLALLTALSPAAAAQPAESPAAARPGDSKPSSALPAREEIARYVQPLLDAGLAPGLVVAIHRDGQTAFHAFGSRDLAGGAPPDEHTLYEMGSINKVFTGILLADAVRRGEVTFDTPIADLLPEAVKAPQRKDKPILLKHLTTHMSGLPGMPGNFAPADPEAPYSDYTQERLWDFLNAYKPTRDPDIRYEYSNLAVGLLGQLLSRRAGVPYETLLRDRVCTPLGLHDTVITMTPDQAARLAPPTSEGREAKPWATMDALAGAGAFRSTAADLMRFALAQLPEHAPAGEIGESLEIARRPIHHGKGLQVACGWHIAGDGSTYWHNGGTGGYSTYLGVNATIDVAVVVLANGSAPQVTVAGEHLVQFLAGMQPTPIELPTYSTLPEADLEPYLGIYALEGGVPGSDQKLELHVMREGDRLYGRITGQTFLRIDPIAEHRFRVRAVPAEVQFEPPVDGHCPVAVLHQNGQQIRWLRTP